jgi:hypothetical protein
MIIEAPHIWVPKFKIIEAKDLIQANVGIEGMFTIEACNRYGTPQRSLTWKQLITNQGLDRYGSGANQTGNCMVGTGTAVPAFTDTVLQTQVATTTADASAAVLAVTGSPPYIWSRTITKEFALGAINATLTEVGMGHSSTLVSYRDLIRDAGGSPTSFPVLSTEQLRVTHLTRVHVPNSDVGSSVTITGSGTHTTNTRASRATDGGTFAGYWRQVADGTFSGGAASGAAAYESAALGTITGFPAGTINDMTSGSTTVYVNGNYYVDSSHVFGLTNANFPTGIGSMEFGGNFSSTVKMFQVSFTPKIDKFAGSVQRILTINRRTSFTRV